MDLLKLFLYLLLIAFPLGVVIRIPIFTSSYIYPIDIALILIFLTFIFLKFIQKKSLMSLPFFKSWILFILFALLSLILNAYQLTFNDFIVSLLYIIRLILYSQLLFLGIWFVPSSSDRYKKLLAISGFSPIILGFIQYFYFPYLGNLYYLGWDEHYFRIFSTFLDPNFAGALFILELLLLVGLFQSEKTREALKSVLYIGAIICVIIAIFLTYSRSSYVMLLASGVSYYILINQKKIILLLFALFVLGIFFLPKSLSSEGVHLLRSASVVQRVEAYQHALSIFSESPIYGVGFNAYRYAQKRHGYLNDKNLETSHSGAGVPNSFLFVLATTGIVGFLLYINFWYRALENLFAKRFHLVQGGTLKKEVYIISAVIASIIGIFVHSLFENTLFYPFVMIWLFLLIGFSTVHKKV